MKIDKLMDGLAGELRQGEPMSRHTSWRAGGVASWFYTPKGKDDLSGFLKRLPSGVPVTWCGLGSNTLIRDGGFEGVVISTLKGLTDLRLIGDNAVYADAGVTCAKLARFATRNSLCAVQFMVGIPGTVGGALAMNAGCFGQETWDVVHSVDAINTRGEIKTLNAAEVRHGYRFARLDDDQWFTGAEFVMQPCDANDAENQMKEYLRKRSASQPVQTKSAGCVFRNPPGDFAARLLETAGLKNYTVGEARVSPVHSNFIENQGNASARDIEELITHAKERVEAVHGVQLELEVKIIGNRA